jgi:anaerobic selenocysteine-containing dehydrogenase
MKVDRRSFLSFLIGGAAGTTLSPLPWKLTDDSSIWTQMWPWTPVPEDGEVSYIDSACTLCPGGCGITVRKINDRAVKIEGMKNHPVNDGGICILGLSGLQLLYGPRRVEGPQKRVGEKWHKISWNDAIAEIVEKLKGLRSKGQSHSVACISSSDLGTVPRLLNRFLKAYGSPNFIRTPSIQDSYEITLQMMHGVQAMAGFDIENSDFILSFGSGIIEGWGSPVHMFKANSRWQENESTVVQIEPRLSVTAAKSDKWIPINPGTETALALGIANVIISESLYNKYFIDYFSAGFDDWKRLVLEKYAPDRVAKITGIDRSKIVSLAKDFARAARPLAICGKGRGATPGGLDEFLAVHALNALVGNINSEGGIWAVPEPDYIDWPEGGTDPIATQGMQQQRLDGAGSRQYLHAKSLLDRLPGVINAGKEAPLQALFINDANPLYTMPNTDAVKQAFDKIPFIVSFSPYMDETTSNADLILPNHGHLERYEDMPSPLGIPQPFIGLARPVVSPQFNTKYVGDVIIQIAKAMGGQIASAFPWSNYTACLKDTLGYKWATLVEKGFWMHPDFMPFSSRWAFDTLSGKFEFANNAIGSSAQFNPVKVEGDERSYPLVLIPYDSMRLANATIGDPPFMVKTVSDTVLKQNDIFVEINPKTAESLGLSEGKTAVLSTPINKAKVKVHLYEGIMPGIIAMPTGLGHTGNDPYLDEKGVNFNKLVGPVEDPASGLNAAWGIRAKLA